MTTIDITTDNTTWTPEMLSALGRMHKEALSTAKLDWIEGDHLAKNIRRRYGYFIIQIMGEFGKYIVETDLTKEQFIEKVKQYL